jgi:hypothetical protein
MLMHGCKVYRDMNWEKILKLCADEKGRKENG